MYLRQEGSVPVFVPEDGVRNRVAMMGNVRETDPTLRARGMVMLPVHRRCDSLLREFLAGKLERCDKREKALIRFFLKQVNAACYGGNVAEGCASRSDNVSPEGCASRSDNPACIFLAIRRGLKVGSFEVYALIRGAGRVQWLPSLVLQATEALARIHKETSPHTLTLAREPAPARGLLEPARVAIPSKVALPLIPAIR